MATRHPNIPGVRFKDIPDLPGYCIGDDGSAWSSKKQGRIRGIYKDGWHQLALCLYGRRCPSVGFCVGGKVIHRSPARLVLEAFVGPCPDGMEACHFPDRSRANNRLDNLRWDTSKANAADRVIHGTHICGERSHKAKLTAVQVLEIKRAVARGEKRTVLERRYEISRTQIRRIQSGVCWAHIKEDVS